MKKRMFGLALSICILLSLCSVGFAFNTFAGNEEKPNINISTRQTHLDKGDAFEILRGDTKIQISEAILKEGNTDGGMFANHTVPDCKTSVSALSKSVVEVKNQVTGGHHVILLEHSIELPTGWSMELSKYGEERANTAVMFRNKDGIVTGMIYNLAASDDLGTTVNAEFELAAEKIIVRMNPNYQNTNRTITSTFDILPQYVFTDFFYAKSNFTHEEQGIRINLWVNKNADGWYLGNYSSDPNAVRDTSWYTVCTNFNMGLDFYNLQGVYEQYVCHLEFAWPLESEWNLEQWRPCVGYAATVAKECNP